jgi:uncharacterized protein YcfJ
MLNPGEAMVLRSGLLFLAALGFLTACATVPTGPSVMVLPGNGKSFEQFQADDATCRQWAAHQTGTTTKRASTEGTVSGAAIGTVVGAAVGTAIGAAAGNPAMGAAVGAGGGLLGGTAIGASQAQGAVTSVQGRYDMSYMQCMYAKGNQIPVARGAEPSQAPRATPSATAIPNLRGTWTGTWGGTPLTLFVLTQDETAVSDVYVGPWLLFGRRVLGLSGVLTFTVRDEAISVNVRGRFEDSSGRLTLLLEPQTANGQQITLTHVDENHLGGVGASRLSWEPQGPVELVRQAAAGPR